jgi:hypothetical protein
MVTGPFDFPRVTNIGPFTETEAEQELNRNTLENASSQNQLLDREISSIHDIDIDDVTFVSTRLTVREEIPEEADGIMDKIKREVDIATRETDICTMDYWMKNDIGRVGYINTDSDFRNMGIATTLKNKELQQMENNGVEIVYTDVISTGGYRLAKKTGFEPIYKADHIPIDSDTLINFNEKSNKGTMFKYI